MGQINVPGVAAMVVFYALILVVGVVAAWLKTRKGKKRDNNSSESEMAIVAGRDIGVFVGIFSMIATWVDGGFINSTAEYVYTKGVLYLQAPVGSSFSLIIGGLMFAKRMRTKQYMTMLDPFQQKYGDRIGGLMYIPALSGELLWAAAILNALGSFVSVIIDLDFTVSVIAGTSVAIFYTFVGGLFSVAYTDVLQLIMLAFGMCLCVPFAWRNVHVNMESAAVQSSANMTWSSPGWLGTIPSGEIGSYVDMLLLQIFGTIPWQSYFQRVLSVKHVWQARALSMWGGLGALVMCIPPVLIGVIARHTRWEEAGYDETLLGQNAQLVLPLVIQYLTPTVVTFFGLGVLSAAVMSSSDSPILSISSMTAHNIYKMVLRPSASETEIVWVLRICIVLCGVVAAVIAIYVQSVADLFSLSSDFVYVILFPQLVAVIYCDFVNSYGVLCGYCLGWILRLLGGEAILGIPAVIQYSGNFPFKTVLMLTNFLMTVIVSCFTAWLFKRFSTLKRFDILNCFDEKAK